MTIYGKTYNIQCKETERSRQRYHPFHRYDDGPFSATPLLIKATKDPDRIHLISLSIFIVSMILLYGASTIYHSLDLSERMNRILRKIDHMMIFVLIAGTYTPVCLVVLNNRTGRLLCALVWSSPWQAS